MHTYAPHRNVAIATTLAAVFLGAVLGAPGSAREVSAAPPAPPYRTIDGIGNNVLNPDWGSAGERLKRLTTADYTDGVSTPAGDTRPSARAVSNLVSAQSVSMPDASFASGYLWQWGQFVDHDIDLTDAQIPNEPFPIIVPLDDPSFPPGGVIGLNRSHYDPTSGTGAGNPRQQVNDITSFHDASMVYGSDGPRAAALRALDGTGRLKTSAGDLLPFNTDGFPNAGGPAPTLFLAGDVRANEQLGLTSMHTLFVREHNRIADSLGGLGLTGDEIYELARAEVGALIQRITFNEFLPLLLGPAGMPAYGGYDNTCDAGIANFFSTGAYRFGHSMLAETLLRRGPDGAPIATGDLPLKSAFFAPWRIGAEGGIDPVLRGLAMEPSQAIDPFVVDGVRNFLFGAPGAGGLDLAALNIQRGRDHGLASYVQARLDYGLPAVTSFADVTADPARQAALLAAYGTVDAIDSWTGVLSEDPVPGASVGPLLLAAMADQFGRLRDCDRFWYQLTFSGAELAEIESTMLADVIRRNTGIGDELPDDVFHVVTQADIVAGIALDGDAVAGASLDLIASATNAGPYSADKVGLTLSLPDDVSYVGADAGAGGTCTLVPGDPATVDCEWPGTTGVGAVREAIITVRSCPDLGCGSTPTFELETGSDTLESSLNGANNTAELSPSLDTLADLSAAISSLPDPVIVGQQLTYSVDVDNLGPSTAPDAILELTLDPDLKYSSVSGGGVSCTAAGSVVTCDLGTLGAPDPCAAGPASSLSFNLVVEVSMLAPCSVGDCAGEPLGSNVTALTSGACLPDPDASNNGGVTATDVLAGADVVVEMPRVLHDGDPVGAPAFEALGTEARSADDLMGEGECVGAGDMMEILEAFGNIGPEAYSPQRNNAGPEFEAMLPPDVEPEIGSCIVVTGGGSCMATPAGVFWNGVIPVGGMVEVRYLVRVKGGTEIGTEMEFRGMAHFDDDNMGINDVDMMSAAMAMEMDCEPTVSPNAQLGCQVHLPILNFLGQDDLCESWIEVQYLGCDFAKASLVTWGEPGFCPPQAAGPLKVECTGLLKPGATWNLLGAQIPNGSKSGILFKWTAKQLSEIGVDLGFDDVVADYMCETLFFGVVGDADDYRRFKKAYNEGLEFGGVPLDRATGGGALAVDVHRKCPGDVTPGVEVTSKYNGIAGTHLGVFDPVYGGYGYYVPLVYADKAGFTSIMYVQNGGLECTSVEVWFQEQDNCLRATICDIATLAPGETYQLDANDCVGPDFQGSAWLRTTQPTGIAVDIVGRDILMTYVGEPAEINYTFDPEAAFSTGGNQVGFAPLIYSEYQGWDSGIQVQNLSAVTAAKVKVYFMDRSGDIITTLVDWVCPRGSQTFFLPVIASLPGNWAGSARVESQEWLAASGPRVDPPNIVAIATLLKYDDAARTNAVEAIAYNLLPEHKIYDWQIGYHTAGNLESGVGLVAIPSLLKDIGGSGLTSELAIANVVPKPGFTDFAIYVYDQNGLLDYVCQKLGAKQVEYIDLQTWGYVNPGFKGSAIISAIFWEHDVHDSRGRFLRNLVGLGAVAIERNSTRLGMDVPGDEAAGSRGIPFAQGLGDDDEFEFCPMGALPLCPGIPLVRPDPDLCPAEATFDCINCPLNIPAAGTSGMMDTALLDVDIAAACTITDVDVLLNLNHTFLGDLVVSVTSPEGTPSTLFTQICGGNNDIMAIVDDDAATPIGSVCSPLGFVRYTTQSGVGLDLFDGESAAGIWMLDINDLLGGDSGMLNNWSVTIQTR